jgi:hypothetical protein
MKKSPVSVCALISTPWGRLITSSRNMVMAIGPVLVSLVASSFVRPPALALQVPRPEKACNRALSLRGGAVEALAGLGAAYSASLAARPIITKSLTAGAIFTLSDVAGQTIAPAPDGPDTKRTITSALVGLFYFGPALHYVRAPVRLER